MTGCEDYRQMIAADPASDSNAEHLSRCEACRDFRDEMRSLDTRIAAAMQISVPGLKLPELAEIETQNVVTMEQRKRRSSTAWFALAASVALVAFIGVRLIGGGVDYDSLSEEVLAHLDHEPAALRVSGEAVTDARLVQVVPADVAQMDHSGGLITYARTCEINGRSVPHLVLQGEHGPVTILLMPEETVQAAETLNGENIHGVILPVGGGSIAIIGARDEKLERIEKSVLNSVTWST